MTAKRTTYNPDAPLYVVMIDHGKLGLEAIVHPGTTQDEVVMDIANGQHDYGSVAYVLEILEGKSRDITEDVARAAYFHTVEAGDDLTEQFRFWLERFIDIEDAPQEAPDYIEHALSARQLGVGQYNRI